MPRALKRGKCTIISIIDNTTNRPYTDNWRENYIGSIGHAVIKESIHKCPGDNMLYFENEDRCIYTSPGKLSLEIIGKFGEEAYILTTKNSTYMFIMSDIQEIQPSLFNKEDKKMKRMIDTEKFLNKLLYMGYKEQFEKDYEEYRVEEKVNN